MNLRAKFIQEALSFHLQCPVEYVEGTEYHFKADFSSSRLVLLRDMFGEPTWVNTMLGSEDAIFNQDGIAVELN